MKRQQFDQILKDALSLFPSRTRTSDPEEVRALWEKLKFFTPEQFKAGIEECLEQAGDFFPTGAKILNTVRRLAHKDRESTGIEDGREEARKLAVQANHEYWAEFERYSNLYGVPLRTGENSVRYVAKRYTKRIGPKTYVMKIDHALDKFGAGYVNRAIFDEFKVSNVRTLLQLLASGEFPSKKWNEFLDNLVK